MADILGEEVKSKPRIPGIVIFIAVMNFVSVFFIALLAVFSFLGLVFGNIMGLQDFVTQQMTQMAPTPNFSYGITFIFALSLAVSLFFLLFFVLLGIGLLKGKAPAWYAQIALCVLGLFAFPLGTAINAITLFFFFRQPVRDFFKV